MAALEKSPTHFVGENAKQASKTEQVLKTHTRLKDHDHYTSSAPLVEKAGLVQVRFTLRLRDQRNM